MTDLERTFQRANGRSQIANVVIAYWFSTMPGTTGPQWLLLFCGLSAVDYLLLTLWYGKKADRG